MKVIKFLQRVVPYQAGEIAGFEDEAADRMIKAEQAVEVPKKSSKKSVPAKAGDSKAEDDNGAGAGSGDGAGDGGASADGNGEVKE